MAETAALINSDGTAELEHLSDSALFNRRIEFHPAKKPFSGFGNNNNSNGFKLVTLNPTSEPHVASGLNKKNEKSSEYYENGLDPELTFEISFRRIGAGLRNLGNTCFLNSVLQCLTYTEPLAAYLQSGKHQNSCRTAGFCALCAIQKHVSRALQSTGRTIEPKDLVYNLRRISRNFRNASQEDAHEYMVYLLESMHKCCLPSGVPSESPSAYEKSLVHKIFGGRLRSQVKCMQCSYCSNKFDPFLDLSLEIMKANSLDKALAHFTAKEQLDGGAKEYQCQQCKQKVKALKQLTIHNAPYVLAVHLKRFGPHALGKKIDKKIDFPPTLNLKPFVTGPNDGNLNYTLYGVLVHAGWSTRSGHYYCFVRTSSGMWYALDDNEVSQVNERRVLEQKAYMLFYVRDRKKTVAKKSVNSIQKENMVANGRGSAAHPILNLEPREKNQNGANEKELRGPFSVALSEGEAVASSQQEEAPSDKISRPNTNGTMTVNKFALKRDPEHSSLVPSTNDPSKEHSVGHKEELCSTVDAAKNITHNKHFGVVEEQNTSAFILASTEMQQDSLHMNGSSDSVPFGGKDNGKESTSESAKKAPNNSVLGILSGNTCKTDSANSEMCASKIMPMGATAEPSNNGNHVLSSQPNSIEESQVGGSSVKTAVPIIEETRDNEQKMNDEKKGTNRIVRRKFLKYQIGTMSLSSNIILGMGLGMRKKKHKRRKLKKHSSMQRTSNAKILLGNDLPSNLGQSVPEESLPVLIDYNTHSQEKNTQCGSDGQNQNLSVQDMSGKDSVSSDVIFNEFRERVVRDGSAVSAEKQPLIRQSATQNGGNSEEKTDVVSMLTRGLDETPVARWGETDGSLSQKSKTRATGTIQIGHVGDEWDEEYDRGKRKKIRVSNIIFGGPNLFQQVATKNSMIKRAKLERSRPGNQPFRI
ncbi:hypothetical protein ACS0TY_005188 [Phlomoides rotata]